MDAKLIKIDRNGSKHFEGYVPCDHCGGSGYYAIGVHNGQPVLSPHDGGVCWKCHGTGKVLKKWIERTPEYQAKLDAKRQAKMEQQQAEQESIQAEADAKRMAREAEIKAQRSISKHVGEIGERITVNVTYVNMFSFEVKSFRGFGTDTMHIHLFKDADGNVIVWKTASFVEADCGDQVVITGTVKDHSIYHDEKQTVLTRVRVKA